MHSDPGLIERLFDLLPKALEPKKMFGGQCWMLNGNMCIGVYHEFLITRIGAETFARIANETHVHPMDITGKPMKGWAMINPEGFDSDKDLQRHVDLAVAFVKTLPQK